MTDEDKAYKIRQHLEEVYRLSQELLDKKYKVAIMSDGYQIPISKYKLNLSAYQTTTVTKTL